MSNSLSKSMDAEPNHDVRRALAPTAAELAQARFGSNRVIAGELLAGAGPRALDIGCGDGRFTRVLAQFCGQVTGVDINARKVAEAQAATDAAGLPVRFQTASAEALPFEAESFDVVVFSNSLHHIGDPDLALGESARVLAPGGLLYVMEPVPAGSYHEATRLVNDETVVRTAAYRALGRSSGCGLSPLTEVIYRSRREFVDFAEWRAEQIERDDKRQAIFEARGSEVQRRFEGHAERRDGRLAFDQVFRINLLRRLAAAA
jgi:ubiquinone/menaquinone biosynthesis C-methylase UbiE